MSDVYFINDYCCGKYDVFNTVDWYKYPYWNNNNKFFSSDERYVNAYQSDLKTPPKSFSNKFKFLRDKYKTISSYEYLRKPRDYRKSVLLYEVSVYSNAENAFEDKNDFLLDKIPQKIIEAINKPENDNIFIMLNYSSEGFISDKCLSNINEWVKNNIP